MNNKALKIVLYGWLVLAMLFVGYKGILPGWNDTATDFNNYYASAKLFLNGDEIRSFYDNDVFYQKAKAIGVESGAKFAPFPPPTAILYAPLSFFDLLTAKRIWLILNTLILFAIPFRLKHYFKTNLIKNAFALSLFFVPLASNLHFGQFYLVAAFLLIEAVGYAHLSKKISFSGALIGFLAVLKYIPLLFVGYLLNAQNRVKVIGVTAASIIAITVIFLLIDADAYGAYLYDFGGHVNGELSGQGKYAVGFQSIDALLTNLFVPHTEHNPSPFIDFPALKAIIKWSILLLIGLFCFLVFRKSKYRFTQINTSIFIVGSFVVIPASATYHFLLLLLPVYFILNWLYEQKLQHLIIVIFLLIGAFFIQMHHIPNLKTYPTLNLIIHFPRLWFLMGLFAYLLYLSLKKTNG